MKIAITFTDQNPDGGAVIGKETYIVPVDEKLDGTPFGMKEE